MASTHTTDKILTTPAPGITIKPIYEYTQEQKDKIASLRQASLSPERPYHLQVFTSFFAPLKYADTLMLPPKDDYYIWELRWLNKLDTIPRYMRASKWSLSDAQKRLKATLEWRREFKPDLIPPDEVQVESETGKMYALA